MRITILSENNRFKLHNYYPKFFNKLDNKYKVKFINIKSEKKFLTSNKFLYFYKYFRKNRFPVILNITETNRYFYLLLIFKYFKVPIIYFHAHQNFTKSDFNNQITFKNRFNFFLKKLNTRLFNFLIFINIYKKIDILFSSNNDEIYYWKNKKKSFLGINFVTKKFKKFIKIKDKSFDEIYNLTKIKKNNFFCFIDIALPYHKDQIRFGYKPINKNYYFENLLNIFNIIKKIYNLDTHIIAHPSYNIKNLNKDYKTYKIKKNFIQKNKSLMNCKFVMIHHSSAIFKAINFNKPVIQITSRKFNNFIKNYDYFFRRKFNLDKIYLEEKSENRIKKIIKQNLKKKLPKKKYNLDFDNFEIFCKNVEVFNYEK